MKHLVYPHIITARSSAGSGKTYNLALRYIQILLASPFQDTGIETELSNILAVTFTNKAAGEMKDRIINWMKLIILKGKQGDRQISDVITEELNLEDQSGHSEPRICVEKKPGMESRVRKVFQELLVRFYRFHVSTIDSFSHSLLKAASYRLGLPPDFELALDIDQYLDHTVDELMFDIVEQEDVRDLFLSFILDYLDSVAEIRWNMKDNLKEVFRSFWNAENNQGFSVRVSEEMILPPAEFKKLQAEAKEALSSFLKGLEDEKCRINQIFLKQAFRVLQNLESPHVKDFFVEPLKNWIRRSVIPEEGKKALLNKNSADPGKSALIHWKRFRDAVEKYVSHMSVVRFSSFVNVYGLFKQKLLREITGRRKIVLINHLASLLKQVTTDDLPEIYLSLADRYFHFLLDEFQDTNHVQWANIRLLVDDALSRGGSLFVVGDKKQSIYRWRGGDYKIADVLLEENRTAEQFGLNLQKNYRSCSSIVNFNNRLFSSENLKVFFSERGPGTEALNVYFRSFQKPAGRTGGLVTVRDLVPLMTKNKKEDVVKQPFLDVLQDVFDRQLYANREIAVLVRVNEEARTVVNWLLEKGFPVESRVTVSVIRHGLIREVISLLIYFNDPGDQASLLFFLQGKIMEKADLGEWAESCLLEDKGSLTQRLQEEQTEVWAGCFEDLYKKAAYQPLYDFVVDCFRQFNLFKRYPDALAFLLQFLEVVRNREEVRGNSLSSFVDFITAPEREKDEGLNVRTGEKSPGVRVMTVHKAKGLEFPVVILPFAGLSGRRSGGSSVTKSLYWKEEGDSLQPFYIRQDMVPFSDFLTDLYEKESARQSLDELNTLYVALTRPSEELHVLVTDERCKNLIWPQAEKNEQQKDLEQGSPVRSEKIFSEDVFNVEQKECSPGENKWENLIRPKIKAPEDIFPETAAQIEEGNLFHYILSGIEKINSNGEDRFLEEAVRLGLLRYPGYDFKELLVKLKNLFSVREIRDLFFCSGKISVLREKGIIDASGAMHRPDRILIDQKRVRVIDLKTGRKNKKKDRDQVRRYMKVLSVLFPDHQIEGSLLYLQGPDLVKIRKDSA